MSQLFHPKPCAIQSRASLLTVTLHTAPVRALLVAVAISIIALSLSTQPANAQDTLTAESTLFLPIVNQDSPALCRFGVNKDIDEVNIAPLRTGWYLTYGAYSKALSAPAGVDFMPTIRLTQTGENSYEYSIFAGHGTTSLQMLKKAIQANPGAEWAIGNEPDRRDRFLTGQDDIEPQVYAIAYHDLYQIIKQEDPTAVIIAGSIVQPTEVRLKYLDKMLAEYKQRYGVNMPVDVWATHNFILNEVKGEWGADIPPGIDDVKGMEISVEDLDDINIFKAQIQRFRQWLAANGYAGTPVYVSEYGVLFPEYWYPQYSPERVNQFMNATFDYMLHATDPVLGDPSDGYRMVQRFSWYSVHDASFNGNLYTNKGVLTAMGANYGAFTAPITNKTDFYPVAFSADAVAPSDANAAAAMTLTARIANSGNVAASHTAIVRFYLGNPSKGVQIGADRIIQLAGCGQDAEVSVQWENPIPGERNLYVVVEPLRAGRESNPANNTMSIKKTIGSGAGAPAVASTAPGL